MKMMMMMMMMMMNDNSDDNDDVILGNGLPAQVCVPVTRLPVQR